MAEAILVPAANVADSMPASVGKAYKRDIVRTLRQVFAFGVENRLVSHDPAKRVHAPKPIRGERIIPFESWAEVEAVAEECGRWGSLVAFMADTGARPQEALSVEHRHVDGAVVELPGTKTEAAWRTVHMTRRGVEAVASVPRGLTTRRVFHVEGRPISWVYFLREIWKPARIAAGLPYRPPYNLRAALAVGAVRPGRGGLPLRGDGPRSSIAAIATKEVAMQPSPEIDACLRTMIGALERGDVATIEQLTSRQPGTVAIGSDPAEYSRDFDEIMGLMRDSTPAGSAQIHVKIDELHAYEEGDIGWADGIGRFEHDGESVQVRMTAVLRREDGTWRTVQSHASIGVPNARMFDGMFQSTTAAS